MSNLEAAAPAPLLTTPIPITELPLRHAAAKSLSQGLRNPVTRTAAFNLREYGDEKWMSILDLLARDPHAQLHAANEFFADNTKTVFSIGNELFEADSLSVNEFVATHVATTVLEHAHDVPIVEIGAGFGNIALRIASLAPQTSSHVTAAEYTSAGRQCLVEIASRMEIDVDVRPCDVLERQVVEDVPTGAIIYTSATLCMLPEIPYRFLERMCELSPREVIHFEPIVEHFEDDELGRLRRDYIDTHDYNTNLRTILAAGETAGLLTIVEEEATVVGENCLLPLSVIVWKPA